MYNQLLKQCFKLHKQPFLWRNLFTYQKFNVLSHSSRTSQLAAYVNRIVPANHALRCSDYLIQKFELSTRTREPSKDVTLSNVLEQLKIDVKKMKRINAQFLITAIELATKESITSADCMFLLNCCSMLPDKPRPEKLALIEQIWHLILTSETTTDRQPSKSQLVQLLRAYKANGKKLDIAEFLKNHSTHTDDIILYEELLYVASEVGDNDGMVALLTEIKQRNYPLTEQIFNSLILGHSRSRNFPNCELVLDTMSLANVEPSSKTYMELIRAFVENGASDKATTMLADRGALFNEAQIFSIIKATIRRDDQSNVLDMAFQLLSNDTLANKHIIPELRNICIELIHANEARKAFRIIEQLPVPKFTDNEDIDGYATFFLSELIRSGTAVDDVLELSQKLVKSKRNARALHVCCEVSLRHDVPEALTYLKELASVEPLRPQYFWPLFLRHFRTNGESGILSVLTEMDGLQVHLDYETIANYVLPKLPITLKDVRLGIKMLEDKGLKMIQLITPLTAHLIYQDRLIDATDVVRTYSARVDREALLWPILTIIKNSKYSSTFSDLKQLALLLKALASKSDVATTSTEAVKFDLAGQLLMELVSNNTKRISYSHLTSLLLELQSVGVRISSFSGEVIQQYLANCPVIELKKQGEEVLVKICDKRLNISAAEQLDDFMHITHPRDMQLDELECHLVELQSKNLNYRGILRRLLQLTVRAGKYQRALEIQQICDEKNVALSPGMLACSLELMIRTKNLDGVAKAAEQLSKLYPSFQLDEHKIIDWAALLVESGKVQQAKELLRKRATTNSVRGGANIHKNVWQLLANMAATAGADPPDNPTNQTKELLELLCELGFCDKQNNTLLGPIIREHLLKGEIKEAIREFNEIAKTHRRTPLHFELLSTLIRISNSSESAVPTTDTDMTEAKALLEDVMQTTSSIHGPVNANVSLVVAFAQSGTEKQLRKILIDPSVQVNMEAILKQCEYICNGGTVEPLLMLAKCSRGLSGSVREQDFYNMILSYYVRQNDFMAALGLFDRIAADDEFKLTAEFTRNLMGLLEKNNLEVPTNVKMMARS